jgi:uncharacterized UPF0160 family protein
MDDGFNAKILDALPLGAVFVNKVAFTNKVKDVCVAHVRQHAVYSLVLPSYLSVQGVPFRIDRSASTLKRFVCKAGDCKWRCNAIRVEDSDEFRVRAMFI